MSQKLDYRRQKRDKNDHCDDLFYMIFELNTQRILDQPAQIISRKNHTRYPKQTTNDTKR